MILPYQIPDLIRWTIEQLPDSDKIPARVREIAYADLMRHKCDLVVLRPPQFVHLVTMALAAAQEVIDTLPPAGEDLSTNALAKKESTR